MEVTDTTTVKPKELSCEGIGVDIGRTNCRELEGVDISDKDCEGATVEAEMGEMDTVAVSVVVAGIG